MVARQVTSVHTHRLDLGGTSIRAIIKAFAVIRSQLARSPMGSWWVIIGDWCGFLWFFVIFAQRGLGSLGSLVNYSRVFRAMFPKK